MPRSALFLLLSSAALLLAGCADTSAPTTPSDDPAAPPAVAFGVWKPGLHDSCTQQAHDRYGVTGPDGKRYPTWHPPVDPLSGCTFGHEHGRDPRGSSLSASVGDIPFGAANEALDAWSATVRRHEDHVGHKIEWENDVPMQYGVGETRIPSDVRCDILLKLHQGTHSKDAFTNNLHELTYHMRCSDGSEVHATLMAAIGEPGEFMRNCARETVSAGTAVPAASPSGNGARIIPDRTCLNQLLRGPTVIAQRGLFEAWNTGNLLETADGRPLAFFDPYFEVHTPSRFYDPGVSDLTGRFLDTCSWTGLPAWPFTGDCAQSAAGSGLAGLRFDDPQSAFNGVHRSVQMNNLVVVNPMGPTTWYTDPFGKNARPEPFAGSVKQYISATQSTRGSLFGRQIGFDRNYGGTGVHAPN